MPRRPREYFEDVENTEIVELLGTYSRLDDRPAPPTGQSGCNYTEYFHKVIEEGTTPNGIFGAKVMWGYFDDFICNLRQIPSFRDLPITDLLSTAFPNLHYIKVSRRDKVRQAISLWKAIQTWTWKAEETVPPPNGTTYSQRKLVFHFEAVDHLVQQNEAHDAAWQQYFDVIGVQPLTIAYEELAAAYEATSFKILTYLDIHIPADLEVQEQRMKKQADSVSEEWVQRYSDLKQEREESILR
jgi:trehalose 2-sulfotransferase